MKIKSDFILSEIDGEYIVVTVAHSQEDFNGAITLNESGKLMWEQMEDGFTIDMLVDKVLEDYDIDRKTAIRDVTEFVDMLKNHNIIS